jgi:hypothetical protein
LAFWRQRCQASGEAETQEVSVYLGRSILEHPDKNGKELDKRNGYIMIYKRYVLMFFNTFFSSSSCWVSTGMGMLFHMTGV